jgi:S-DNA-T family DNA segregation ATPase FtsK/SpoIIIE
VGDRDLKKRAEVALQLLLSQGRAPGVLLVAAVQDPGKDVIGFRDLFPTRIALRLLEDAQVDMVLGRSARLRGAECDQIPASLPGVGYVVLEGVREPVRVRAAHVTDDDLAQMVRDYTPSSTAADETRCLHLVEQG